MSRLFWILSTLVFMCPLALGDTKISQLPLKAASTVGSSDSLPFVNDSLDQTDRVQLWDLVNLPSFQSMFLTLIPSQAGNSSKCLSTNGTNTLWAACGGANTALSNLVSTSVNANLIPASESIALGDINGTHWGTVAVRDIGSFGSNQDLFVQATHAMTLEADGSGSPSLGPVIVLADDVELHNGQNQENRLLFYDLNTDAFFVGFKAPATLAASTTYTWPGTDGSSGYVLQTNGSGVLSWAAATSGTVTSVTSSNADIGVATGTTTPVLTLNSGTTGGSGDANKIAKLDSGGLLTSAMIPSLDTSKLTTGTLAVARGGTGIGSGTSGGLLYFSGSGTIASSGAFTANQILLGGGTGNPPAALGSLGTTTTLLHGNASGPPSFSAVSLTADVSGTLSITNGGTGQTSASGAINALVPSQTSNSGKFLTTNGTSVSWGTGGSGANTALSNLASTAINTDLHFDTNNAYEIGSSTTVPAVVYVPTVVNTNGSSEAGRFTRQTGAVTIAGQSFATGDLFIRAETNTAFATDDGASSTKKILFATGQTNGSGPTGGMFFYTGLIAGATIATQQTGDMTLATGQTNSTVDNVTTGSVQIGSGNTTANHLTGNDTATGQVRLSTGSAKNSFSGGIGILTGDTEWQSGDMVLHTGDGLINDVAYSGEIQIYSGAVTGISNSGNFSVFTGATDAGTSGKIQLSTGNSPAGTSGDFVVTTGASTVTRGKIVFDGHVVTAGSAPTPSSCGSGSPSVAGNDVAGRITVGTGGIATSCTLTFVQIWGNAPICTVDDESTSLLLKPVASTTTLVISAATPFGASDKLTYHCIGYQ